VEPNLTRLHCVPLLLVGGMSSVRDADAPARTGDAALPAVCVQGATKRYRTRRGEIVALEGVDLSVEEGGFTALLGPSGCGKSTLLKLIAGIVPTTTGTITIHGTPVTAPRREVGMMFQSPVLLPWRTVIDNVLLPIDMLRLKRKLYRGRARDLLGMVGLHGFAEDYPRELSGGMQQRVAICRALIHDPMVLALDEPFGAVDSITREELNDLVLDVWTQTRKTIILVTHDIAEAVYLSDEVVVMSAQPGRVTNVLHVALPRPRTLEARRLPAFEELGLEIRRILGGAREKKARRPERPATPS
jgi:NitT/TauT family transport system ATP-binding protein